MPRSPAGVRTAVLVVFCALLAATATKTCAEEPQTSFGGVPHARLQEVLDHCYNLEDDAEAQIAALDADFPESLVPEFIAVARLYWMQSYLQVDHGLTERFEVEAHALLEKAQRAMRRHPDNPDAITLAALSHLTLGGFYADNERWWKAFWRVRAGRNLTLRILKDHPEQPEALMPAGVLECYLARTPPVLKPLAALMNASGDIEKGFDYLRQASERAVLTANDARFYLCILQIGLADDPESARQAMEVLAQRYPQNPYFQRLLGVCELRSGFRVRGRIRLAALPDLPTSGMVPAIIVQGLMQLCRDYLSNGEFGRALETAERAGAIAATDERLIARRVSVLFGEAEALHGLGRTEEALARLAAVPESQKEAHERAVKRIREMRAEAKKASD